MCINFTNKKKKKNLNEHLTDNASILFNYISPYPYPFLTIFLCA